MATLETVRQFAQLVGGKIVVAAILLLVGIIIARLAERFIHYMLRHMELNRALRKVGMPFALEESVSLFVKYALYFVAFVVTLNQMGLASQALAIASVAVILVVIVSVFLGLKDFIPNYWAGIFLYRKQVYKIGDWIEVNGIEGQVTRFGVLDTTIKTRQGDVIYLPSSLLMHSQIQRKR